MDKHTCVKCGKLFSKKGLTSHMWRAHTLKGKKHKPTPVGTIPWNAGLTIKDRRVATYIKKAALSKTGKPGTPFTAKRKREYSKRQKAYLKEHPEMHPNNLIRKRGASYPEKIMKRQLDLLGMKYKREFKHGAFWYDFAFPEVKLDFEIDGSSHLQPDIVAKDKRRDEFSISKGWTVVRYTAASIQNRPRHCAKEIQSIVEWLSTHKDVEPFLVKIKPMIQS